MLEKDIQNNATGTFERLGYRALGEQLYINGEDSALVANFRKHFAKLNEEKLGKESLSDTEFTRVMNEFPKDRIEAFKKLRNGISIVLDTNKRVNLDFIDFLNSSRNVYEVANEVWVIGSQKNARLDKLVFINGVPVSEIEYKAPDVPVAEAINQIDRYVSHGVYTQALLRFVQVFTVSNSVSTRYFASSPNEDTENYSGAALLTWMDDKNKLIEKTNEFITHFYEPKKFTEILGQYMFMVDTPGEARCIVMRANQIHSIESAMSYLYQRQMDTYICASTGSGKTITSLKLAQMLVQKGSRVIHLVDRLDLEDQTMIEFRKYDTTGLLSDKAMAFKGRELNKALRDPSQKFILTTIHSMSRWITDKKNTKAAERLSEARDVVFVVDECHRTTAGDMLGEIKTKFLDESRGVDAMNCNFVGFTGTPLLEENAREASMTTQIVFGEAAHIYTITEAIRDKTVLPFRRFALTIKLPGNQKIAEDEMTAAYYKNPKRTRAIADEIALSLRSHALQHDPVKNVETGGFSAMLAVDGKQLAYNHWEILKDMLAKQDRKAGVVFSAGGENSTPLTSILHPNDKAKDEQTLYIEFMRYHDSQFGTAFESLVTTDFSLAAAKYNKDVVERVRTGEIDLLIVSDMLLTGFDAPQVNTIYLDKQMEYHALLQAISRTNRIKGTKKLSGNIVFPSDRNLEERMDDALKLFGSSDNIEAIVDSTSYKDLEKELRGHVTALKNRVSDPTEISSFTNILDLKEVISLYNKVRITLQIINTFPQWDNDNSSSKVGISIDEMNTYYEHIETSRRSFDGQNGDNGDPIDTSSLEFVTFMVEGDVIDLKFLMNLLNKFVASPPSEKEAWMRRCYQILQMGLNTLDPEMVEAFERLLEACEADEIQNKDQLYSRLAAERDLIENTRLGEVASELGLTVPQVQQGLSHVERFGTTGTLHYMEAFKINRRDAKKVKTAIEELHLSKMI